MLCRLLICDVVDKYNRRFLWDDTEENKRMHSVNWKEVCKPKDKGGVGIR